MIFTNRELETTFELPDKPTARQLLRFDGAIELRTQTDFYERLWAGCVAVASDWQSVPVPELSLSVLEAEAQPGFERALRVVKWAGLTAFSWRRDIERALGEALKNA